jgi:leucyl aminopeptidase
MPSLPQAVASDQEAAEVACDVLVVGAFSTGAGATLSAQAAFLDETLGGYLNRLSATGFKGKIGELALVPTLGRLPAAAIGIVGLGPKESAGTDEIRRAAGAAARRLAEHAELASQLHHAVDGGDESLAAEVQGFLLGSYRYTQFKSDPKPSKIQRLSFLGGDAGVIERATVIAEAALLARDLTNEPASSLTPGALARKAQEIADVRGLECTLFDENALKDGGFGGILGVSQGSSQPPFLIKLRYVPGDLLDGVGDRARGKVALVGKGVTYDSGGYSIKPAAGMEQMKTDMAGAAAVLAVMGTLQRLGVTTEVEAYIPATENMISGAAIKPGDVLTHYGGKTTEVNNTDAEGRLILGDAIAFASEGQPHTMIDVATLTGSIQVALGGRMTGMFSNDDDLRDELIAAGDAAGEGMWPMPIIEEYKKEIDSEVADTKNTGSRHGGAIVAALFLRHFLGEGIAWAHLDIAGTARAESDCDYVGKGATGVPVRTLIEWITARR